MVIYLDLLIIIALLTNGSIFYLAGKLAAAEMRAWRLILADILAAMMTAALLSRYGVYLTSVWGKIAATLILARIAYPWRGKRFYCRVLIFLMLTASMVSALCLLAQSLSGSIPVVAGIALEYQRPSLLNLLTALGLLGAFTYYHRKLKALPANDVFYQVELAFNGQILRVNALADTGNRLLSAEGKGVMLGHFEALEAILPNELWNLLSQEPKLSADRIILASAEREYAKRMQLISYYTIDRHSFLAALRIDEAIVYQKNRAPRYFKEPVLAFAPQKPGEDYDLIIPAQMIN